MSALEIRRYKRGSQAAGFCSMEGCKTEARGEYSGNRRSASAELYLLGWSVGEFCPRHAKEMCEVYDEAAGLSPDRDMREALAA